MTLVKWNRNENDLPVFSNFFDNFLNRETDEIFGNSWVRKMPSVNIKETEESYKIEVAVPGLNKEDFRVNLENNMLTIEGSKESNHEEKNEKYTRKEFDYNAFKRSFTLPNSADTEKIDANYTNGILYLTIHKKEEAKKKPAKAITIS